MRIVCFLLLFMACVLMGGCRSDGDQSARVCQLISGALAMEDSDVVLALDMYEEAYDILDVRAHDYVELKREAHLRLGLLFMRNGLGQESIEELHAAYAIDSVARDTVKMAYSLRYLAFAYESIGQISESRRILSVITDDYVVNRNYVQLYDNLQTDVYSRYEALQNHQQRMPEKHAWATTHLTPKSNELPLAVMGLEAEQKSDPSQASNWYRKLSEKHSPFMRAFAQLRLMGLQLQSRDLVAAARSLEAYQETLNQLHRHEAVSRTLLQHHAKYQDRRAQRQIAGLRKVNRQQTVAMVLTIVTALLVVGILLLLIRVYRQRQAILRFKVEKLRQWREEWLACGNDANALLNKQVQQADIYVRLRQKLNGFDTRPVSAEEWNELQQTVLSLYPHFRERLLGLCKLSDHDYHVCLLLKVGVKPSDIARLTMRSDEAISSTRRRLFARAFGKKGTPSEWDEVIGIL